MIHKRTQTCLVLILGAALLVSLTACQKLSYSNLRSNYHFGKANKYFEENLFRKAITEYEEALKYNPRRIEAYRYLGESYKQLYKPGTDSPDNQERAAKSLEALRKALEIDASDKNIIYSIGDMYDKMRDFKNAEKMYLRILDLEPQNMNNYYIVAEFYKKYAGENPVIAQKVESMYLRRIEADPENPQGYAYMSNYYDNLTPIPDFDKAVEYHLRRIQLDPKNAEIFYAIGVNRFFKAYRLQNQLSPKERDALGKESEKYLQKTIEMDPSYPWSYAFMNMLYRNVFAPLYPDRSSRYVAEADRWAERFQDIQKRDADRKRLEKELKKSTT
ncbi:MAG: tetratricopeptide repeat protein [Candidatus Aminicenantes bacterium]|nr:tetratricopeptide repeat protein [Candidatus Aminicenantes bacterium]